MPNIENRIDAVSGAKFISVFDVQSAYHQVPIHPDDKEKTAFVTQKGKLVFNRLPFGISSAPDIFMKLMDQTFSHLGPQSGLLTYMDDILLCSKTFEHHLSLMQQMFEALAKAGLTLHPGKIAFARPEISFLGYVISQKGGCYW